MAFRQKTKIHSLADSFAIGQGSAMTMGQAPYSTLQKPKPTPTLSQQRLAEADQNIADVVGPDHATMSYGW